jgi:hypothetical protein
LFFIFRYKDYIKIRPHPAPKKFENFELTGKIYCKHCHWEWGVMGVYKKVSFPIIKISSFVIDIVGKPQQLCKKWKEVPFKVSPLSPSDLAKMLDSDEDEGDRVEDESARVSDDSDDFDDEEIFYAIDDTSLLTSSET